MTTCSPDNAVAVHLPTVLLVGPYDPHGGEYTFLAPPLGVWRLAGVLQSEGIDATVFDPNCCEGDPHEAFAAVLREKPWSVVGFSTTGMTLRFDLALAHLASRVSAGSVLVAGGMEATFRPDLMFDLGPFDLVVLGEGERPLLDLVQRLKSSAELSGIRGTAYRDAAGTLHRIPQAALTREELRDAIFKTPYEQMPYAKYWERLERAYRVGDLPYKADREARLAEIRSVRLITLNYCPMRCTFCSSTNFLTAAQDSTARLARLNAEECVEMMKRIVRAHPDVRTIIFQDDIFVFVTDARVVALCDAIVAAKTAGELPAHLQFISTNRIDAMNPERLAAMRRAGFRVLGFGIENFSLPVLTEFNKARIYPHIEPTLRTALDLGMTPFLDMILTSPRCSINDLGESVRQAYKWMTAGCEVGMYPYVIPFSGAEMANDPSLLCQTVYTEHAVDGTSIAWKQPAKILPFDPAVRAAILQIESDFERRIVELEDGVAHLPSRVRSLLWVVCAIPVLRSAGQEMPDLDEALGALVDKLPGQRRRQTTSAPVVTASETAREANASR
jgi:radical SAM superfamily enzyme YgiQ (UPF0313 family)